MLSPVPPPPHFTPPESVAFARDDAERVALEALLGRSVEAVQNDLMLAGLEEVARDQKRERVVIATL